MSVDSSSRICRDDLCELEGLHLSHQLTPFHVACPVCLVLAGTLCTKIEACDPAKARMCGLYHHKRVLTVRERDGRVFKPLRDPWTSHSSNALDDSILRATSDCVPRTLAQLVPLVEDEYGRIAETDISAFRRMQRHLRRLSDAGQVLQVDLGKRMFAYVAPSARVRDADAIRERILSELEKSLHKPWELRRAREAALHV